uniref:Uncharacterized protein n=1 Tax=Plectus sambesii TaxID=2011161 RepID=A0A914UHY1_9BILA
MAISPPYITPSETPNADGGSSTTTPVSRSSIFFNVTTVPPPVPKHQTAPVARPLLPAVGSTGPSSTTLISTVPFNSAHPLSAKPKLPPKPSASPLLRKKRSSSGSSASSDSPETDDSGAEICSKKASGVGGSAKRKGHPRSMRGEEEATLALAPSSVAPNASPMIVTSAARKKHSGKWTTAKGGGSSVLDAASFVNSSFQSEDLEGGSSPRQQVLQHS